MMTANTNKQVRCSGLIGILTKVVGENKGIQRIFSDCPYPES